MACGDKDGFIIDSSGKQFHIENLGEDVCREDFLGFAEIMFPPAQKQCLIAVARGEVYIMGHNDDGFLILPLSGFEQFVNGYLVFEIEKTGRFVEQQDFCILGKCAGDKDPLSFTAA